MSVKSLSIAERGNAMVIEPIALAFAVLRPGCQQRHSRKSHKWHAVRLLTQQTSTHP